MSQFIKFYFTSSVLNMFRTVIHPSSRACDFSIVSPHWLCVLVSMCVGVSVWLGWSGIRVAGWSLSPPHGYHGYNRKVAWHQVGLLFFNSHNDARSNIHKNQKLVWWLTQTCMCVIGNGQVEHMGRRFLTMQESKSKVLSISGYEAP